MQYNMTPVRYRRHNIQDISIVWQSQENYWYSCQIQAFLLLLFITKKEFRKNVYWYWTCLYI